MKGRASIEGILLAVFFIAVTGAVIAAFALKEWRPPVASDHGRGVDSMITYILIVTGAVFLIGHVVLVFFLLRYREAGGATYKPVSDRGELWSALVPVLVMTLAGEGGVLLIGLPVWSQVYGPPPKDALEVEVVGRQFAWMFRYPGADGKFGRVKPELVGKPARNTLGLDRKDAAARNDIVVETLVIPAGRPIVVRLRSHDVLHSFSIPEFRVKQDIIPGLTGRTQFIADRPGTYEIACAELCGMGHYTMRAIVKVLPEEEFKKWLAQQSGVFE